MISEKKNCHNCKWLEYYEDAFESGYVCNGGAFLIGAAEQKKVENMQRKAYRLRGKVCFESRAGCEGIEI